MSNPLVVGQILQLLAPNEVGGQTSLCKWHYLVTSVGGTPATDADFVNAADVTLSTDFKGIVAADVSYRGLSAQIIWPPPLVPPIIDTTSAGLGTLGTITSAKQGCGITSWYTALAGKAFRGRTYWPFIPADQIAAEGEITGAYQAALDVVAAQLMALNTVTIGPRTATVRLVLYHRASHTTTPIVARNTQTKIATQKRRGDFKRLNAPPF